MKKSFMIAVCIAGIVTVSAEITSANSISWADAVAEHSENIQNYGGTIMDATTEFWVMGPPDADADNNGFAWDSGDQDYVAGWRSNAPGEYIIVHFSNGLIDIPGDDLNIHCYGGPNASANVFASTDGMNYDQIGVVEGDIPGYLRIELFDFEGLFHSAVHYVKVERVKNGSQTAFFFDAFGGVTGLAGDFDQDGDVDGNDFLKWQRGELSNPPSPADLAAWQANFGCLSGSMACAAVVLPEPGSVSLMVCTGSLAFLLAPIRKINRHITNYH
ncbi:MAG: hypothetical protein JW829_20870 [Pirellulales bacterium]|nr:hypothetical protein [Pirellulales bacterium]